MARIRAVPFAAFVTLAAALVAAGCSCREVPARPAGYNVVLILVDALRPDHLGSYGSSAGVTPDLDRLAAHGLRFANAYSNATFTFPSTASLFTATLPPVHRITWDPKHQDRIRRLSDHYLLIAEAFHDGGYATGVMAFRGWVSPTANYRQGVDVFVEAARRDSAVIDEAILFVDAHRDQPFFLYVHLIEMHDYYQPRNLFAGVDLRQSELSPGLVALKGVPQFEAYRRLAFELNQPGQLSESDLEHLIGVYDRRLEATDRDIRRLVAHLESARLLDTTLVSVTSDHGEQFLEHGRLVHGADGFFNEVIHIPWIVSNPRVFPQPVVATTPVSSIDIGPTLLDMVGLEIPPVFQGESVVGRWDEDRTVYASDGRTWKAITREWSYIGSIEKQRDELYHLVDDPGETTNLAEGEPEVRERLRNRIIEMARASYDHPYRAIQLEEVQMPPEQVEALRELGYLE